MIDFCHWSTSTTVSGDKISSDGYEAENLISQDAQQKQNGYMAERFIKLPINITFYFPCPISIWRIIIDPVIGSQKTSGIGLFTTPTGLSPFTPSSENAHTSQQNCAQQQNVSGSIQSDKKCPIETKLKRSETCVGRISMTSPGRICFHDPEFRPHHPHSIHGFQSLNSYPFVSELRHIRQIYCANHLTIRIYQTLNGSVGAIKKVEVWGQTASSCPKGLQKRVHGNYFKSTTKNSTSTSSTESQHFKETNCVITENQNLKLFSERRKISEVPIPEEFIDSLSCEMMTIPMLLPCGRNIDKSSLDRFISVEASWGRQPSDPFTGVSFSSESFPLPNDALKGRIDHFLLTNESSANLQSLPRTVSTIYEKQMAEKRACDNSESTLMNRMQAKRCKPDIKGDNSITEVSISSFQPDVPSRTNLKTDNILNESCSTLNQSQSVDHCHEASLQTSLNSALANVLGSLPSFRKTKRILEVRTSCCAVCNVQFETGDLKYQLSCDHVICRDCLLKESNSVPCHTCQKTTEKKFIKRLHR